MGRVEDTPEVSVYVNGGSSCSRNYQLNILLAWIIRGRLEMGFLQQ